MSLPPLPQFTNEYEGEKIRYLVQVLENALKDFSQVDLLSELAPITYPQFTTIGSAGSAETTLYTGNVNIQRYYNPGWQIKLMAFGTFASNSNTKELKLYLNGIVIYDSGTLTTSGGTWSLDVIIIVASSNTQQILVTIVTSAGNYVSNTYSAGTVTLLGTNSMTLTATGVATNDIVGQAMILTTQPN